MTKENEVRRRMRIISVGAAFIMMIGCAETFDSPVVDLRPIVIHLM
jgi:hypothetical protein